MNARLVALLDFLAQRRKAIAALVAPWVLAGLIATGHAAGITMPVDLPTVTAAITSLLGALVVHETTNRPPVGPTQNGA